VAGYDLASQVFDPDKVNRIVLVSDGGANVGITDADIIGMHAGSNDEDGIYMVGVGVGTAGSYNDYLMDRVTDLGKGAAAFIPSEEEAWKVFGTDFVNTMAVSARDVRVELDLPPGFEIVKYSAEQVSGDPTEVEPQHLAPNDAMVFHQTIRTCAPELVDESAEVGVTVLFKDADTFEEKEVSSAETFETLLGKDAPLLHKGAAVFAYTEALRIWREQHGEPEAEEARQAALAAVAEAAALLPGDGDLAEIQTVLESLE
jgi:Ca-activated chloride channel family protein